MGWVGGAVWGVAVRGGVGRRGVGLDGGDGVGWGWVWRCRIGLGEGGGEMRWDTMGSDRMRWDEIGLGRWLYGMR